jgi:F-type H+-transporting ATPase subunit a
MNRLYGIWIAVLLVVAAVQPARAQHEAVPEHEEGLQEAVEEEFDAVEHSIDGNYLEFSPWHPVELPRLFLAREADGGWAFDTYGSTAAALRSGKYALVHTVGGHTETVTEPAELDHLIEEHEHLHAGIERAQGHLFIDFSITRHLVFGTVAILLVLLIFLPQARRYKKGIGRETAPKGIWQNMMESIVIFIRDDIARPNIRGHYERFLPFLLSVFFFVLVANLLGLVPNGVSATANLSVTLALALITFVLGQVNASKDHWRHIFWPPGVPGWIKVILVPVEVISLIAKHFVLAVRLFANMLGGTIVIFSIVGLTFVFRSLFGDWGGYGGAVVSVALSVVVMFLKILVALIQAYIFALLSAIFIGMAMEEHHHEHHDEHTAAELESHA